MSTHRQNSDLLLEGRRLQMDYEVVEEADGPDIKAGWTSTPTFCQSKWQWVRQRNCNSTTARIWQCRQRWWSWKLWISIHLETSRARPERAVGKLACVQLIQEASLIANATMNTRICSKTKQFPENMYLMPGSVMLLHRQQMPMEWLKWSKTVRRISERDWPFLYCLSSLWHVTCPMHSLRCHERPTHFFRSSGPPFTAKIYQCRSFRRLYTSDPC